MPDDDEIRSRVPFEIVPTNVPGVFALPAWPEDFDPDTASQADLRRHGLLRGRPSRSANPGAAAAWEQVFSRRWRAADRLIPELTPRAARTRRPVRADAVSPEALVAGNWAGASVTPDFSGFGFGSVVGGWVVPAVSRPDWPQGTDGGWSSATWIGLGGAPRPGSAADGIVPLPDVVAVGISQDVNADGEASYGAWAEWFYQLEVGGKSAQRTQSGPGGGPDEYLPSPLAMSVGGFSVAPGDAIYAQIMFYVWSDPDDPIISTVYALIYLANGNNGQHTSLLLGMPSPASELGNTAEWIMDCPGGGFPASSLPAFTPVDFGFGFACLGTPEDPGPDAAILGPGSPGAQTFNITQNSKRLTSVTTATTFPMLQISYIG